MKKTILFTAVALAAAISLTFIGCSSSSPNTGTQVKPAPGETVPPDTNPPGDNTNETLPDIEVDIVNFAFSPAEITVPAGTTVIWTNSDAASHTVTSDDGVFDSGTISQGNTFRFTFDEAGTYPYYCTIHPYMKATVIVE